MLKVLQENLGYNSGGGGAHGEAVCLCKYFVSVSKIVLSRNDFIAV